MIRKRNPNPSSLGKMRFGFLLFFSKICLFSLTRSTRNRADQMLTSTSILSDDSTYLMEEWDFDRNNQIGVFPDQVSRHSNKKVWWKCKKCGHCWQTSIANRTRGTSCPKCAQELRNAKKRRAQKGVDDLATLFPEIAKTWNYERNTLYSPWQWQKSVLGLPFLWQRIPDGNIL